MGETFYNKIHNLKLESKCYCLLYSKQKFGQVCMGTSYTHTLQGNLIITGFMPLSTKVYVTLAYFIFFSLLLLSIMLLIFDASHFSAHYRILYWK